METLRGLNFMVQKASCTLESPGELKKNEVQRSRPRWTYEIRISGVWPGNQHFPNVLTSLRTEIHLPQYCRGAGPERFSTQTTDPGVCTPKLDKALIFPPRTALILFWELLNIKLCDKYSSVSLFIVFSARSRCMACLLGSPARGETLVAGNPSTKQERLAPEPSPALGACVANSP